MGREPRPDGPLLSIDDLSIAFGSIDVVRNVSLRIAPWEFHAVVGESGSGKTMIARAVLGLLPPGGALCSGAIRFEDRDLARLDARALRAVRGRRIGMVFQDPMTSLNPALRIGVQMAEALRLHFGTSRREAREQAEDMLERVAIPDPRRCLERYPHEFSGGMRQRIMLASVLLPRPRLLVADEPTTALDAIVQAELLDIMRAVTADLGTAVLFISHNLGIVADRADRVSVMHHGDLVDQGAAADMLMRPRHPKTRALLNALPSAAKRRPAPAADKRTLLSVRDLHVTFGADRVWPWFRTPSVKAVRGVDLELREGETLALVGASGSGKTTVGRALMGLVPVTGGTIRFQGRPIQDADAKRRRALARQVQIVFQDPMSSLDPRMRLQDIVAEGLRHDDAVDRVQARRRAHEALEACGMDHRFFRRFPHQLSGGQRQRVGIARALVLRPKILVLDEPVSALDMTVQAQTLDLLMDLKQTFGLSFLMISHDLGVVEQVADRVAVMVNGQVVEHGTRADIFERPKHPFTRRLLSTLPELKPEGDGYVLVRRPHDTQREQA